MCGHVLKGRISERCISIIALLEIEKRSIAPLPSDSQGVNDTQIQKKPGGKRE